MPKPSLVQMKRVALEASSACQLKCPACPTASGETGAVLGAGHLSLENFKRFVDAHPQVGEIELSNWGEILLNKELPRIIEHAYRRDVAVSARNGVNLNHAPEAVLEAMARWRFRALTVSVDGASPETYAVYRVGGDFNRVIANIQTLNRFKARYKTRYPELEWQFVAFGHNQHEIDRARALARELGMTFRLKLSWDDLYDSPFSPVQDKDALRRATGTGVADRAEYREKYHQDYVTGCCVGMWNHIKINHDGRVLGCCINYWGDYGNIFTQGAERTIYGEKMEYARGMLMGRKPPRSDIPCTTCKVYKDSRKHKQWLNPEAVRGRDIGRGRRFYRLQNKVLGEWTFGQVMKVVEPARFRLDRVRRALRPRRKIPTEARPLPSPFELSGDLWRSRSQFSGRSAAAEALTVHTSVLAPGHRPHPPHSHKEEEILILLEGEADLLLPDHPEEDSRRLRLRKGEFVYYPAFFHHTLEPVGDRPAVYTMFKWRGRKSRADAPLPFARHAAGNGGAPAAKERETHLFFQGPSRFLSKLRAHGTALAPGAGYPPHRDPYDVAVVLLEGNVESLGREVASPAVLFYRAGEPHGMRNPGPETARYLVLEFHPSRPSLRLRALRRRRWRPPRLFGGVTRRLRGQ